jgi:Associated with zinc fingers
MGGKGKGRGSPRTVASPPQLSDAYLDNLAKSLKPPLKTTTSKKSATPSSTNTKTTSTTSAQRKIAPPPQLSTSNLALLVKPSTIIKKNVLINATTPEIITDSSSSSDESEYVSANKPPTNMKSPTTTQMPTEKANPSQATNRTVRAPPPIILKSADWRKTAPIIFQNQSIPSQSFKAKISTDGNVSVLTPDAEAYRFVQKTLQINNIAFHTYNLPEDRTLKVVFRGVPTDISEEEIANDLTNQGFEVKLVKRFGTPDRPMPICLVIIRKTINASEIYNITNLFYISIKVETYNKTGPSQCHSCQRFGHGSNNCSHPVRCVKCGGEHATNVCGKPLEETPTCCNCGGSHTANYRGCPSYVNIIQTTNTKPATKNPSSLNLPKTYSPPLPAHQHQSYANVTSNSTTTLNPISNSSNQSISINHVLSLLVELLTSLSTSDNSKDATINIINSFIALLKNHNV